VADWNIKFLYVLPGWEGSALTQEFYMMQWVTKMDLLYLRVRFFFFAFSFFYFLLN
jgi:hypothetical protein